MRVLGSICLFCLLAWAPTLKACTDENTDGKEIDYIEVNKPYDVYIDGKPSDEQCIVTFWYNENCGTHVDFKISSFQTDEVKKQTHHSVNFDSSYAHFGHDARRLSGRSFEFKVGAPMQNETYFTVSGKRGLWDKQWKIKIAGKLICDPNFSNGKCGPKWKELPRVDFELRRREKPVELKYPIIEGRVWDCLCF